MKSLDHLTVLTITVNPALDLTALVHSFQAGCVNRIHSQQEDPGGKGVNVASFLADFKVPVRVSGFLGEDNNQAFRNLFLTKGIDDAFFSVKGRTRTNIKVVSESEGADGITDLNFPGFAIQASDEEKLLSELTKLAEGVQWCVISGSLPEGASPDLYARLITLLKAKGIKVALDTSGEALRLALDSRPDCIKPNEHELGELLGITIQTKLEARQAANTLHARGLDTVIVSMGAQGALFCDKNQAIFARPPVVSVLSTVGAGDAMVAGYVLSQLRGLTGEAAAQLATALSVAAVTQLGPRLPSPAEIEAHVPLVQTEVLS